MQCSICGFEDGRGTTKVEKVTIHHEPDFWEEEGFLKPHHVIEDGEVKAPVCGHCMSDVFTHMAEENPEGALAGYGEGEKEIRQLKALAQFHSILVDGFGIDHDAIIDLIENLTGEEVKFEVTLTSGG